MAWKTVKSQSTLFKSSHLVMQTMRRTSIFSKMKKENKDYRILLLNTGRFLRSESLATDVLIGKVCLLFSLCRILTQAENKEMGGG